MNWLAAFLAFLFPERKIMSALTDLQAAVAANTAATAQAAALITQLQAEVADLTKQLNDGDALTAMTAQLTADDAALSATFPVDPAVPAA